MKLLILLCLLGVTLASVRRDEFDSHTRRQHQLRTNQSPKKDKVASGGGSVWDMIMVRGANGQLESHTDFLAEQRANADVGADTSTCKDCLLVAKWLKIALKDGEKIEEYKGLLEMMCNMLGGDEKQECLNIIDNLPAYIHQLEPLLDDPRAFCKELGLCGSSRVMLNRVGRKLLHYMAERTKGPIPSNDVMCDECMFLTKELKTIISEQATEEQVKDMLKSTCSELGSYEKECEELIDQYFPLVWDELEALLADGRGLCNELGMCQGSRHGPQSRFRQSPMMQLMPAIGASIHSRLPSRSTPRLDASGRFLKRVQTENGIGAACVLCKEGLKVLLKYVKDHPKAIEKFEKLMRDELCQEMIPSQYEAQCNMYMEQYLMPALSMMMEELTPNEVCDAWQVCTEMDCTLLYVSIELRKLHRATVESKASMMCQACVVVAEFAQHEAGDTAMQADVEHYMEQVICPAIHLCDEIEEDSSEETPIEFEKKEMESAEELMF